MADDSDLINLYSGRILELASDIPLHQRLASPDASAKKRAPLCGSTVTIDLCVESGKISAFGQDVKACALGQAAAAILGGTAVGCTLAQLRTARAELTNLLKNDGPAPQAPFEEFEVLRPAGAYQNRHASILLSLDATIEAFEMVQA